MHVLVSVPQGSLAYDIAVALSSGIRASCTHRYTRLNMRQNVQLLTMFSSSLSTLLRETRNIECQSTAVIEIVQSLDSNAALSACLSRGQQKQLFRGWATPPLTSGCSKPQRRRVASLGLAQASVKNRWMRFGRQTPECGALMSGWPPVQAHC